MLAGIGAVVLLALVGWLIWRVPPALYAYVPDPTDRAAAEASTRTRLIAGLSGLLSVVLDDAWGWVSVVDRAGGV